MFRLRFILRQIALNTLRRLEVQNHPPNNILSGKLPLFALKINTQREVEKFLKSLAGDGRGANRKILQNRCMNVFFLQVHIASLPSSFLSACGIVSISLQSAHRAQCVVIRTPPWEVDQKYVYGIAGMSSSRPAGQIHDRTNTKYTRI